MSSCLFYEKPIMAWVFKSNILIKGVGGIYKIKIWILCKTPLRHQIKIVKNDIAKHKLEPEDR